MNLSIIVPIYKGETLIEPLIVRLGKTLPTLAEHYEVILVNDGSPDHSWQLIQRLAQDYAWIRGICMMRNYGQHNATLCGVRAACYEITITMDQDLQHPPEEIPLLLAKLEEGYDVIYGTPRKLPQALWRNAMTATIKWILAKVIGLPSIRNVSAFRAFRTSLRDAFADFRSPSLILDVLLSWGTTRFTSVDVNIAQTEHTNYNFKMLVRAAMLILVGYSTLPLRFASWLGFAMTLFGLGIFIYVMVVYFTAGSLPGFPFLASIIALFSGAQLFALGIFGEYLARMFDRIMDKPSYIVHEMVNK